MSELEERVATGLMTSLPIAAAAFCSVNQMLPSGPEVMPVGGTPPEKALGVETGNSVIVPDMVIRPIEFVPWSTNHMLPSEPAVMAPGEELPGGAKVVVIAAIALVGTEVLALGVFGKDAWAEVYFKKAAPDALPIQVQAEQFGFYFRYAGPDGKFGALHPDKIDEGNQNFFGLDPANDVESRDDIISASLIIPVNKPVLLMMHAKDVGHSFYVRELRIQQDFVPGLDIPMHFTATKAGKYEIVCTQLCGLGHYNMRAFLEVKSQDEFDQWLKQQSQ